jgi:hypothetical protein
MEAAFMKQKGMLRKYVKPNAVKQQEHATRPRESSMICAWGCTCRNGKAFLQEKDR